MRILVIRPGALGDVILTLPALKALQTGFPEATIEVMGNLSVLQLLPGRSVVTTVSTFDRADLVALFQPDAVPTASLQDHLNSFDRILSYAAPPAHIFVRNLVRLVRGSVLSFDPRPAAQRSVHMSEYLQQPLRQWGIMPNTEPPHLALTPTDQQDAAQWWAEHDLNERKVVAIHPGSGSPAKNWPAERFVTVANCLAHEPGTRILWLSGPADAVVIAQIRQALGAQESIWLDSLPLPLLAAILARCQLYLGNDSGVSHLAAAVGTPTVAIFGPSDPDVWTPRGPKVRIVRGAAPCTPCSVEQRRGCQQRICLEAVPIEAVLDAFSSNGRLYKTSNKTVRREIE